MVRITKRMLATLVLLSSVIIVLTGLVFLATNVKAAYTMPMKLRVVHKEPAGFDLNTSVVTFGKLNPGQSLDRYFSVNNTGDETVRVVVRRYGELAPWVTINTPIFNVTPEQHSVTFQATVVVPEDAKPGNYTGKLLVIILRQ
ncbi:MAG: hypothetical protein AABY13_05015 [Nanoarchaeota archaeon]